nr:signal peptidase complex-like protein DTM1 [Ipomoea batatas]
MNNEAIFRVMLCWLAAAAVFTGIYTHSFKKTAATYIFGMFAICSVLLPDWEYFDRDVTHWLTPVTVDHDPRPESMGKSSSPARFRLQPVRMAVYITVYGLAFYKWWNFIIST